MEDPFRIRRASSADLDRIADIERHAFSDPWSVNGLRAHLDDRFLVAEVGGRVAGYIIAREIGDSAEILNVAVARPFQRRGIARALVRSVLDALRAAGRTSVFLEVRASNHAGRALYAVTGFRPIGRRPGYYRVPPEDALVLERLLTRESHSA